MFRADNTNTARRGGAPIAISSSFYGVMWRADFEIIKACLWIEISIGSSDNFYLLLGNHYFVTSELLKIIFTF